MMWKKGSGFTSNGEKIIVKSSLSHRTISYDDSLGEHQVFVRNMYGSEEHYLGKFSSIKKVMDKAKKYMQENPNE